MNGYRLSVIGRKVLTSVLIIGVLPFLFNAHAYAGEKRDSVGLTYGLKATAQTTYIWRGMYAGGPNIELDANVGYGGAYIDMWWHLGTTDYTFSKFLPEVDLTIGFARWGFDINLLYIHNFNCPFFDFRNYVDKGNRLEINASYTISKLIPLGFHWATRIAAADGYIDEQGKLVQAYSSFAEVFYTQKLPFGLTLYGAIGITPWRSCYTAYKRNFAVQNLEVRLYKDWAVGSHCGIQLLGRVSVNPSLIAADKNSVQWHPDNPGGQSVNANVGVSVYLK